MNDETKLTCGLCQTPFPQSALICTGCLGRITYGATPKELHQIPLNFSALISVLCALAYAMLTGGWQNLFKYHDLPVIGIGIIFVITWGVTRRLVKKSKEGTIRTFT